MYTPYSILLFYLFKVSIVTSKHVKALFSSYCEYSEKVKYKALGF